MFPRHHVTDLDLVERALEGRDEAIAILRERHQQPVESFLRRAGASVGEAEEIAQQLWTDCLVGKGHGPPLFDKYLGRCALEAWLKTVAVNVFLDQKRRQGRVISMHPGFPESSNQSARGHTPDLAQDENPAIREASVLNLMRDALLKALARRRGWEVVMLHLHHVHGLTQRDLATLWNWHESKISRSLDKAMQAIAEDTMARIKQVDPWLELRWEDFVELAGGGDFSLFAK